MATQDDYLKVKAQFEKAWTERLRESRFFLSTQGTNDSAVKELDKQVNALREQLYALEEQLVLENLPICNRNTPEGLAAAQLTWKLVTQDLSHQQTDGFLEGLEFVLARAKQLDKEALLVALAGLVEAAKND